VGTLVATSSQLQVKWAAGVIVPCNIRGETIRALTAGLIVLSYLNSTSILSSWFSRQAAAVAAVEMQHISSDWAQDCRASWNQ
jgi:hypothetical protein